MTNYSDDAIAGSIAGAVAKLATAPLDVLKIRYQIQYGSESKYNSVYQSFRTLIHEEGIWYILINV